MSPLSSCRLHGSRYCLSAGREIYRPIQDICGKLVFLNVRLFHSSRFPPHFIDRIVTLGSLQWLPQLFWLLFVGCASHLLIIMTKGNVKKRVKVLCASMPFERGTKPGTTACRSYKSKQKHWMLDGLRALKAPIVSSINCYQLLFDVDFPKETKFDFSKYNGIHT